MNKSILTNAAAAAVCLSAMLLDDSAKTIVLSIGMFALSGALTNWIAVTMLFEKIPGFYGSGVIQTRFEEFKHGIRTLIMEQFFTRANVERIVTAEVERGIAIDPEAIIRAIPVERAFDRIVDAVMESKIGGMLGMFGGPKILETMRPGIESHLRQMIADVVQSEEFQTGLGQAIQAHGGELAGDVVCRVEAIVGSRLDELTPGDVKRIVQEMIRKHLGWLVVWGGVFGGLIGLASGLLLP